MVDIAQIVPKLSTRFPDKCSTMRFELPKTPEAWKEKSKVFETKWNLPHCVGALDGKHIILQAPINSGTEYFNYKSNFSIVLFALVDANANFLFADVGCQGRISDGGVFRGSTLHRMIEKNQLGLPMAEKLPGRSMSEPVPYFFVGDSAFALSDNLMKPYHGDYPKGTPQRIFNYRLSRARQVVEDAFGIMSAEFRVLRKPMLLAPEKIELVVMAAILLHNFIRTNSPNLNTSSQYVENIGSTSLLPMMADVSRSRNNAQKIRDEIADYCLKEGFLE